MCAAIEPFQETSQKFMPSGWVQTPPFVKGMQLLDLCNRITFQQVSALCKKQKLLPPKGFVKNSSFHYGKYDGNTLVSVLSLSIMKLNKTPGSIAISVDIAVSFDKKHSMSIGLESLKMMLRKRRNKCVIFAQVAQTASAQKFWEGKLTKTRRASVLTALISMFDSRYKIYEDADDMAIFFE